MDNRGIATRHLSSPSLRLMPDTCPCGLPVAYRTWESDLYLCKMHGRDWLRSPEKVTAGEAIEKSDQEALRVAVGSFITRITKKPTFRERLRAAYLGLIAGK